jgi:glycosyltransferase involved in cell wall biosynthesis
MPEDPRPIEGSTFTIVSSGIENPTGGPVVPLRDFLLSRGAHRVTTIFHPLEREQGPYHRITHYQGGRARRRSVRLPSRPPFTYALDPVVPLVLDPADAWFGMNNLVSARGLLERARGRVQTVVYWAIDFVPERFGASQLTRIYDVLDALCCQRVDARFEGSQAALEGRNARHGLGPGEGAPTWVVPHGAWISRIPRTSPDGWKARRVMYVGHLVPRQGVDRLLDALAILHRRGVDFQADLAGDGPLRGELQGRAAANGLGDRVRFPGFIEAEDLEALLASSSVAVAPYATTDDSFTRYADPGKLRLYTAAGLPVVLTDVPPNAAELAREGVAEVVPFDATSLAAAIERAFDRDRWTVRRSAALRYSERFDWGSILSEAVRLVGYA